ncbi:CvpA family protein [Lederbergia graminis]|uniref:CvpA family protein n=1 Tax=Lederbergia graminis TaxID=735518 RepID=A0ABW0LLP3_9BACI|nr:CvpA family protein [Paenibacillus bovis]HLU20918.1 CvpA family protein [Bacillaceae bacterium]
MGINMLDLALIILLIIGLLIGFRRGFILQLIHMIGFIISFIVAYLYYDELAPKLKLWIPYPDIEASGAVKMVLDSANFDESFYRAIAFVIIFIAVRILLAIIGSALDIVASLPLLKSLNLWAGGILGFIEMYLLVFILLYITALLPLESIQTLIDKSTIAEWMLNKTPYFSAELKKIWLDYIQK